MQSPTNRRRVIIVDRLFNGLIDSPDSLGNISLIVCRRLV